MPEQRIYLRCGDCNLPVAHLENGAVVIKARHSGDRHVAAFAVLDLIRLAYPDGEIAKVVEGLLNNQPTSPSNK